MTTQTETATASKAEQRRQQQLRRRRTPSFGWVSNLAYSATALGVGAVVWETIGQVGDVPFFPPLSAVLARLVELIATGEVLGPLLASLRNLVIGFGFSVVVGVGLGLLMGAYKRVEAALDIYVYAMLTAPSLVFAPVLFSIFGLGPQPIVGLVILYAIFIIIINTVSAVQTVPVQMIEMGRSFGANDRQLFRRIIIPSATPMIMAGLRLGAGRAVKGMINGEMFIAAVGLGAIVMRAGNRFDATSVLAILVLIILVAFGVTRLVQVVDLRLTSWLPETQRGKR